MILCTCMLNRSAVSDYLRPHGPRQALLSMEFSRQEYWSGLPVASPEDLPNPGIEPGSLTLQADSLPSEPLEKLPEVKTPLGHFRGMTFAGLSNSPDSHLLIPTGPGLWEAKMRSRM